MTDLRAQLSKLAEAQKAQQLRLLDSSGDLVDFPALLAEFDRFEAAAREYREADKAHQDAYDAVLDHPKLEDRDHGKITETSKRWRAASVALDAALAPSTGKSEKPDG